MQITDYTQFLLILIGGLLVALVTTWAAIKIISNYAESLGLIDKPDHRKIHVKPIPRIGGLGIFAGLMASLLYFSLIRSLFPCCKEYLALPNNYFITGGIVIAVTGLVDDFKGISFRQKLVVQSLIAVYIILAGYRMEFDFGVLRGYTDLLSIPITFLWIIGVINAMNLIDGMDGLAGGTFLISLISLTICYFMLGLQLEVVLVYCMVGVILGFLILNWHPAKIFMGDTGSLFLGYVIACYSLKTTSVGPNAFTFMIPIMAVGLPVFDTLLSMTRRQLKGRPMFYPDKDHMHHRMGKTFGGGQRITVLRLYSINIVLGALAVILSVSGNLLGALILVLATVYVGFVVFRMRYLSWAKIRAVRKKPRHRGLLSTGGTFPYRF